MNQRIAEAMAQKVQRELGKRASRIEVEKWGRPDEKPYWMVGLIVDNRLHLGFAEPKQWLGLKERHGL
jgi:hypothetical protein